MNESECILSVKEYHGSKAIAEYKIEKTQQDSIKKHSTREILLLPRILLHFITNCFQLLKPYNLFIAAKDLFERLLLPIGYPDSVCPEYIRFQFWDTSQEACGYFRGILSNQAWLTVLGVGNADVTVVNAVVMTMLIDYSGMVSGLWFAGSRDRVRMFAGNQKHWTMVKEVLLLVSAVFTIGASLYPDHIIWILLFGRVVGTAANVIGGSCQSTLVTHIARNNNFSDCNAKEGNQSRTLKLFLIGIAYKFLIFVNRTGERTLVAFVVLSLGKLFCVYRSMTTLQLRTFSPHRLYHCLHAWYHDKMEDMTITKVAKRERILFPSTASRSIVDTLGCSISNLVCSPEDLSTLNRVHSEVNHILVPTPFKKKIMVVLREKSTTDDYLLAYIHCCFYSVMADEAAKNDAQNEQTSAARTDLVRAALHKAQSESKEIVRTLERFGWDTENFSLLPISDIRVDIKTEVKKDQ